MSDGWSQSDFDILRLRPNFEMLRLAGIRRNVFKSHVRRNISKSSARRNFLISKRSVWWMSDAMFRNHTSDATFNLYFQTDDGVLLDLSTWATVMKSFKDAIYRQIANQFSHV